MFLSLLFLSCVDLPSSEIEYQTNISEESLFEDWSEDWENLEEGWSQEELSKEERVKLKGELEVVYFDRIVPYKQQLHSISAQQLLDVELSFGRLLHDIEHRRKRKISAKTSEARKQEMVLLKEHSHQLLELLAPKALTPAKEEQLPVEKSQLNEAGVSAQTSIAIEQSPEQ